MNVTRFPAFNSRDYRVYWPVSLLSNIGSQMQIVALNWQIYLLTHSAFALGFIGFLRFVPILGFSLLAGSVADAHNRKRLLYVTQFALLLCAGVLAVTTYTRTITPAIMFGVTVLTAMAMAFNLPAMQAFVPSLLPKKDLANAMSLNSIMFQLSAIAGPALSGVLIGRAGTGPIYAINAVSFLLVLIGLRFMRATGQVAGARGAISLAAIMEGLRYVKSKTIIWSTMLLDFFSTLFGWSTAVIPIYAKDILAVGPHGLGLLYAAPAIGAVIASLFVARRSILRHQGYLLLGGITVFAIGTLIFGVSRAFPVALLGLMLVGGGDSVSMIIRNTIRQLETPDYIRGRMTSVNMIFFMGGPQLGDFEAGTLANYVGAPWAVITGGVGTLLCIAFVAVRLPVLRDYDHHEAHNTAA